MYTKYTRRKEDKLVAYPRKMFDSLSSEFLLCRSEDEVDFVKEQLTQQIENISKMFKEEIMIIKESRGLRVNDTPDDTK